MTLQETHIYIRCPIRDLLYRLGDRAIEQLSEVSDSDDAYSVAGIDGEPDFGVMADLHAPSGQDWTQLLHSAPEDLESVAKALHDMQVTVDMLESASDWDNNPLVALEPIAEALTACADRPSPGVRARGF